MIPNGGGAIVLVGSMSAGVSAFCSLVVLGVDGLVAYFL
jgi:hypothetical protein